MPTKNKLSWSGPAIADLRAIRAYVKRDNPPAAKRLATRIKHAVSRLRDFPQAGRVVPELATRGYREVVVEPYRIVYETRAREVIVLRVWHGRRDIDQ